MAGLLVAIAIMGVLMSVIMPTWRTWAKRDKEAELVFRGGQYARAIELFQRRNGPGTYPADIETLVEGRFLRQAFPDPMVEDGAWEMVTLGSLNIPSGRDPGEDEPDEGSNLQNQSRDVSNPTPFSEAARGLNSGEGNDAGPIVGVRSRSTEDSLLVLNGRRRYDEWLFTFPATGQTPGAPTAGDPALGAGQGGFGSVAPGAAPGAGGAFGSFGQTPGQPGTGRGGRGGRGGDAGRSPGSGAQRPGAGGSRPGGPGVGVGQPGGTQSSPGR